MFTFLTRFAQVAILTLLVLLGGAFHSVCAENQPVPLGLETFDAVWKIINENHFDTNFSGVDWQAAREKYRPKAAGARNPKELRKAIQEMLDLLKVSHLRIISSDIAEEVGANRNEKGRGKSQPQLGAASDDESGTMGFEVRLAGKDLLVSRVWPGTPASDAGVQPGWIIRSVNEIEFKKPIQKLLKRFPPERAAFLTWRMASGYLLGPVDTEAAVAFVDGSKKRVTKRIRRVPLAGEAIQFGSLPTLHADLASQRLESKSGLRIGYIRFNIWMLPAAIAFTKAMDEYRSADGLILDLRGNVGGVAGMVMGLSGHFFDKQLSLGTMKTRDSDLNFFINPRLVSASGERVQPYSGPLAILVDEISASASEIFAGGFQDLGRARIFGRRTTGQALPAFHDLLPNGDVLYHPFADFVTSKGTRIEGMGVIPDVLIPLKRDDLLAKRDPPLEAAIAWIESRPSNAK